MSILRYLKEKVIIFFSEKYFLIKSLICKI